MALSRSYLSPLLLLLAGCAGGGGGGGGGGDGPILPPIAPTAFTLQAGLASVAPGQGALRIDFTPPPSSNFEVAAFVAINRNNLFATAPHAPAPGSTTVTVAGLTNGTQYFIGLGIRPTTGGAYRQIGPSLTATPGSPLFVDAASNAANPDGLTPATAFRDLLTAVLTAFANLTVDPTSSQNVWVKGGSYDITSTLPITAGVNVYGGFGAGFNLASRDIENSPTIWNVGAGQSGFQFGDQLDTNLAVIVDGVRIKGNSLGAVGADTDGTDPCQLELRSVVITDMTDRGLRLRNLTDNGFDIVMSHCQSSRNGADGLSGNGAFDYSLFDSIFAGNVQEGVDLNDLTPESNGVARMTATSCQFFGNGAEGLDCTLGTPLVPSNGSFQVSVHGCMFERNVSSGCLMDADFELVDGYSADVLVRESTARGNGGFGFHFDLDGPLDTTQDLTTFVYRVLATSNAFDGIYATSESRPGLLIVSNSAMVGNIGAGLRAEGPVGLPGNRTVAMTHCLLAGNFGGGVVSRDRIASVASSLAYQQPNAFDTNTRQVGDLSSTDPADFAFLNAPEEYAKVLTRSGGTLNLSDNPGFSTAFVLELADDTFQREASSIAGTALTLTAEPDDFGTPGMVAAFAPGTSDVDEDYRLGAGSTAMAAGMNGADSGLFGSPVDGRPGLPDELPFELFYPVETSPPQSQIVPANDSITIAFSRPLNGATANAGTVRARRGGNSLSITLQTAGNTLTVNPPVAGWGAQDFRIELDGLRANDGTDLSSPLFLNFSR